MTSWTSWGLAVALLLGGCGQTKNEPDPSYSAPLVTMEDVDDSLAEHVQGDRVRVPYDAHAAIKGAEQPLVTIVEFSDFQCPFCGQFANTLDELLSSYPEDVRLVFMQYPMPMHPDAPLGAKATLAAAGQGRFWAMHDRLFAHRTAMKRDDLLEHAKALGLDVAAFEAALDDPATGHRLEVEQALGHRLAVRGTPTFFVNGRGQAGAMDGAAVAKLVEEERQHAKRLLDAGAKREEIYARIMRAARPTGTNPGPKPAAQSPIAAPSTAQPAGAAAENADTPDP
jgi:protein-disulfide isomerase